MARVIRRFTDPLPMTAVAEAMKLADLPTKNCAWPEPADELLVIHLPSSGSSSSIGDDWLAAPGNPDAPLAVSFSLNDGLVRWRPGRAVIDGEITSQDDLLAGLAEFAFYEGQLRSLEQAIGSADRGRCGCRCTACLCHPFRGHWPIRPGFRATIERLSTLRLTAARLEPRLYLRPRSLPLAGRQLITRLRARADIENRLEAISDRLEACEDLYEGAVDRITDHRWYRKGMWVEIAIVILLFLEVLQLAATMFLHGSR